MSTMKNFLGMLGGGSPASNPFVGANLLTQHQANQAMTPAMMQAGLNLLANSGWKTTPTTLGQAIGTAGQAGMQAYNQDLTRRLQLQDMATKRAAAQTAAARSAWEHDQKVKMLQGNQALAAKYGLSGAVDPKLLAAHIKTQQPQSSIAKAYADYYAGRMPKEALDAKLKSMSAPGVSIDMKSDPMRELHAKSIDKIISETATVAANSAGLVDAMQTVENILNMGLKTGPGAVVTAEAQKLLKAVGFDVQIGQSVGQEVFTSLINRNIGPLVKQLGQNPTDRDLQFIVDAFPQLGNSVQGNLIIAKALKRDAARKMQVSRAVQDVMSDPKYEGDLKGMRIAMRQAELAVYKQQPILTPAERNFLQGAMQGSSGSGSGGLKPLPKRK